MTLQCTAPQSAAHQASNQNTHTTAYWIAPCCSFLEFTLPDFCSLLSLNFPVTLRKFLRGAFGLAFPCSQLINRLKHVELLLRDEAQQWARLVPRFWRTSSMHLIVMIGDHRQPAGSRPNYHFVTELLEQRFVASMRFLPTSTRQPPCLQLLRQTAQSSGP